MTIFSKCFCFAIVLNTIYNVNFDQPVKYSYKHYNITYPDLSAFASILLPCSSLHIISVFSCELTLLITTSPLRSLCEEKIYKKIFFSITFRCSQHFFHISYISRDNFLFICTLWIYFIV